MKLLILLLLLIILLSFPIITCGQVKENKQPAASLNGASEQKYRFSTVLYCDEDKKDSLCVDNDELIPGQAITILDEQRNTACYAETSALTEINTAIGSRSGFKLVNVTCKEAEEGSVAVINGHVATYKKLHFTEVKNVSSISSLDKTIRKKGFLNKFKGKTDSANSGKVDQTRSVSISLPT